MMKMIVRGGGTKMEAGKTQPDAKFRAGGVTATVWQNRGEKGTYATVKLSRSYMDKDNSWKETNSFRESDIPKAALVLNEAYKYLQLNKGSKAVEMVAAV
jgi:hypothetical protein